MNDKAGVILALYLTLVPLHFLFSLWAMSESKSNDARGWARIAIAAPVFPVVWVGAIIRLVASVFTVAFDKRTDHSDRSKFSPELSKEEINLRLRIIQRRREEQP